jgi:hypothetical protein
MIKVLEEFKNEWISSGKKKKIEFIVENLIIAIFAGFSIRAAILFAISVNNGNSDYLQSTLAISGLLVMWIIGHKPEKIKK